MLICAAWFFFDPRKNNPETGAYEIPENQPGIEEQVSAFLKKEGNSPGEAYHLASRLSPKTKAEQDSIYKLYYFAAENGEPASFKPYASCLDPSRPQWGSIEKNAPAALNAYKRMPDAQESAHAIQKMIDWLKERAAAGDDKAREWLDEIS